MPALGGESGVPKPAFCSSGSPCPSVGEGIHPRGKVVRISLATVTVHTHQVCYFTLSGVLTIWFHYPTASAVGCHPSLRRATVRPNLGVANPRASTTALRNKGK